MRLRRLRSADGDPLAIMTNYLPDRFTVTDEDLVERGLYATLRAQGVAFAIAHQTIGARLLTAEEAELLGETEPAACVTMERLVYDDTGRLVELGPPPLPRVAVHRADLAGDLRGRRTVGGMCGASAISGRRPQPCAVSLGTNDQASSHTAEVRTSVPGTCRYSVSSSPR